MTQILRAAQRLSRGSGPFQIRRTQPGLKMNTPDDFGLGPLALIDHAHLGSGLLVPMHEHRNDEIISYMRSGTLWHEDTEIGRLPMTSTQFAVMNSGSGISHEESIPEGDEPVEMLQIFIRPTAAEMEPKLQTHQFAEEFSKEDWRLIAGPDSSSAPLTVRNQVWVYDRRLTGETIQLDSESSLDRLIYVFSGSIVTGDEILSTGDSMIVFGDDPSFSLATDGVADLVLFQVDRSASVSRAGTLSG